MSREDAAVLASGWSALAQGQAAQAAAKAAQVLAAHPRSGAAFMLAVEADIAQTGAVTGLDRYERWIGGRTQEEPAVLRRIARAVLYEELAGQENLTARAEAAWMLAGLGEQVPPGSIPPLESNPTMARVRAALGDEPAVRSLVKELQAGSGNAVRTIEALGSSGSKLAAGALSPYLQDQRPEVRAVAVEALGRTGGPESVALIKPLLNDRLLFVRARAAGALYQLGDSSGVQILNALAADPSPSVQLLAAEGMASQRGPGWSSLVRSLAASQEPEVRASAARLIAQEDPELAKSVLDALMSDANPAIRDLAASSYVDTVVGYGVPDLRRLLRQSHALIRVRAAGQLLEILQ
jgi:hypothetical protein